MEKTKRLSLEDFKLSKLQGNKSIESLMGGTDMDSADDIAASCHTELSTWQSGNTTYIRQDPVP